MTKRIGLLSAEQSGDQYAAHLIQSCKARNLDVSFQGMGGPSSQQAGLVCWPNCSPKSVMGFNLLKHYQYGKDLLHTIEKHLDTHALDLLILIDYGGINLRVLRMAHKKSIRVLYYVPPKTWAWGKKRLRTLKLATRIAVHYPFEYDYFTNQKLATTLVPHPFGRHTHPKTPPLCTHIALLPGSRVQEIVVHLPIMLESVYALKRPKQAKVSILLTEDARLKKHILPLYTAWQDKLPLQLIKPEQKLETLTACHVALACSGTVTYELAALGIPMLIMYKTHWLTYRIAKALLNIRFIGLPNLIENAAIIPELIQHDCDPERIANALGELMQPGSLAYARQKEKLLALQTRIRSHHGTLPIDQVVQGLLGESHTIA